MKFSEGWGQVIRFDDYRRPETKTPEAEAQTAVCSFMNTFVDIFNQESFIVRLRCVLMLGWMVLALAVAAVIAQWHRLPYVEPTHLEDSRGKRVFRIKDSEKL